MQYPPQLEIVPLAKPPNASVRVPGSKSITNRALVLAALTASREHDAILKNVLRSEDTEVMIDCLGKLGFQIKSDWDKAEVRLRKQSKPRTDAGGISPNVIGSDPVIPVESADLFVANSGTTMRFLTALVALGHGRFRLDGSPRMRERPIEDLLDALRHLGVNVRSENNNGCPPVIIEANGLRGGTVRIKGDTSSQFLSGLLMAATRAADQVIIETDGEMVSSPYVDMTAAMIQDGIAVCGQISPGRYLVMPMVGRLPVEKTYVIEADATAASYFFASAAITGGVVTASGLPSPYAPQTVKSFPNPRLQGDVRFVDLLESMGCRVLHADTGITVQGRPLHGIDVDMNDISDTVMTLAAAACFADGPTTIRNVAHIRHKESDRIAAMATELRRVGAKVDEHPDGLTITPAPLHGAVIQTYNDHRIAMSMALIGLKIPGIIIDNPACVAKTYPRFFEDLAKLASDQA